MIRLAAARRPASGGEADAALAGLGGAPGLYFGIDGGIAGLHPLRAILIDRPALALHLFGDGVEVHALGAFGASLLQQPPLAAWRATLVRGAGAVPLHQVRAFLRCFAPSPDMLLAGALPFAAHRLRGGGGTEPLGILFFPERFFRRDASGAWEVVTLATAGASTTRPPPSTLREPVPAQDDLPPGGYAAMVARAIGILSERPLVSLTLSQTYRRRVQLSPVEAFRRLRAANPAPATFFFNDGAGECLLGASPDLQLVIERGVVQALPVCGTVARGEGAVGEAESLRELLNEEVDAASLAVCTDALRNDLAPLCEPGSLQLLDRRRPMSLATVVHAVDRVRGTLRADCDAWDAIAATAAPVMVTGTPRGEALAAIGELEPSPRGWYGGMVVQVDACGDALVGTILRAAAVRDAVAQVRTGGDLLASSSPQREEQESRLKTRSLWRAFGLEAASQLDGAPSPKAPLRVALAAEGDPFAAALRDCLHAVGAQCDERAAVRVLAGTADVETATNLVAIGDAAARLLQAEGFAVEPIAPRQGEPVRCRLLHREGAFIAARYLRWRLAHGDLPAGWDIRALDGEGIPQVLVHPQRRVACILFRPDSLLSQPTAREVLREALEFVAAVTR